MNVNWYANDPAERLAVLTTFIRDPTSHELGYAMARKAEAGIELAPARGFGLNLVAFSDRTTGGVGYRSVPDFLIREHFQLSDSTQGTGVPPEIIEPASYADTVPVLIHVPDNNLTLESKGFEGTLDLPEFRPIRTRLNVQASWIETRYFKKGIDFGQLFSEFQLSEHIPRSPYWEDPIGTGKLGLITYRLIHHQPALGLVITGTIQHTFKETERDIAATDTLAFAGYITRAGELVPVPPERRSDPEFEDLSTSGLPTGSPACRSARRCRAAVGSLSSPSTCWTAGAAASRESASGSSRSWSSASRRCCRWAACSSAGEPRASSFPGPGSAADLGAEPGCAVAERGARHRQRNAGLDDGLEPAAADCRSPATAAACACAARPPGGPGPADRDLLDRREPSGAALPGHTQLERAPDRPGLG